MAIAAAEGKKKRAWRSWKPNLGSDGSKASRGGSPKRTSQPIAMDLVLTPVCVCVFVRFAASDCLLYVVRSCCRLLDVIPSSGRLLDVESISSYSNCETLYGRKGET
jgi:hypothetical protein